MGPVNVKTCLPVHFVHRVHTVHREILLSDAERCDQFQYATRRVTLHKRSNLDGNLAAPAIVIEEGAVFTGTLDMETGIQTGRGE